jgi:RNA polymerase sigma-70 factor (ECF subfamily)
MADFAAQPFPITRWSLISRARISGDPMARGALDELLRRYLPALTTHLVLSRRLSEDRADELLQGFIASRVVEQQLLSRSGPEKGRFRTFLLVSMNNFLVDQIRAAGAQKRGGDLRSLDDEEAAHLQPPDDEPDPSAAYEIAWARRVIEQAAALMHEQCAREDRSDIWEVFKGRLLEPALDGAEPIPYEQLIARFGYESPDRASNVLMTAKRSFQRALRQVVADYCEEGEVEAELRELQATVARPGRRI